MLKFIEFALLAVSLLIVFGLVTVSPCAEASLPETTESGEVEAPALPKL
jgi:hypothetical protein